MRRLALRLAIGLGLLLSGCTLTMSYDQCSEDADCPLVDGQPRYCTSDHLCVKDTPEERLCTSTLPLQPAANATRVGLLLNLPAEQEHLNVLGVAIDDVNEQLALDAIRPLVLEVCNVRTSATDAVNATRVLTEQRGVPAILGPNDSDLVEGMFSAATAVNVPVVSPAAMAGAVADLPTQGLLFRMAPLDRLQGQQLARMVPSASANPSAVVAVLSVQDPYGDSVSKAFVESWKARDPSRNLVRLKFTYREDDTAQRDMVIARILETRPDHLVLVPGASAALILKQLAALPFVAGDPSRTSQIYVSASGRVPELLTQAADPLLKDHFFRIQGLAPLTYSTSTEGVEFRSEYETKYKMADEPMIAYSNDALYVVAAAIASAKGRTSSDQILSVLRRLNDSKLTLSIGRSSLLDTARRLAQGDAATLSGATGAIRFQFDGSREPALFEKWTVDTAKQAFVNTPVM
jgi:ABC-type branched-subunit amino acid transport system substrate-binding protein